MQHHVSRLELNPILDPLRVRACVTRKSLRAAAFDEILWPSLLAIERSGVHVGIGSWMNPRSAGLWSGSVAPKMPRGFSRHQQLCSLCSKLGMDPLRRKNHYISLKMTLLGIRLFRAAYLFAAIGFELSRVPWWLLKYIPRSGRQVSEWSYSQALAIQLLSSFVYHIAILQPKTNLSLEPGKEDQRFVLLEPAPTRLYRGPLEANAKVCPIKIGATWYPTILHPSETTDARVVLHIHGGAYVLADGRPSTLGSLASALLDNTSATHLFAPQYRLSALPVSDISNPFPAALQDSVTAYFYLVKTLHIPPKNIVLSGDSAGGHNAVSLLRYLTEHRLDTDLPLPTACWLWSPWIQPNGSEVLVRRNPNFYTDYLPSQLLSWGATAYTGNEGRKALESKYVSLLRHPFRTETPVYLNAGEKEVFYFEDVGWVECMKSVPGNDVTLDVAAHAPHDPLVLLNLGFAEEATASVKRCEQWMNSVRPDW